MRVTSYTLQHVYEALSRNAGNGLGCRTLHADSIAQNEQMPVRILPRIG